MLDTECILSLNFLAYKGIQTGDHHGMRYRMIRAGEEPDFRIDAWVWPEPFSFEFTPEEKKTQASFPFSEEGRLSAIHWMQEQYETRRSEWDHVPTLLGAMR
jgi:hypothetical protein